MTTAFDFSDKEVAEYIDLTPKAFSELKRNHPKRYELYRYGYVLKKNGFTPEQISQMIALKQSMSPEVFEQKNMTIEDQREQIEAMILKGYPVGKIGKLTGFSNKQIADKLKEWRGEAYHLYLLHITRGRLINIKNIYLREGRYKKQLSRVKPWGGADVVISFKPITNTGKYVVVTPCALEHSWLFDKLRDAFEGLVDYLDKYKFYGLLAEAASKHIETNPDTDALSLLYAVYEEADAIYKEIKSGEFYRDVFTEQGIKIRKKENM